MKAYKDENGTVRLFRPMMNLNRFHTSMQRIQLPVWMNMIDQINDILRNLLFFVNASQSFDKEEFLKCMKEFLKVESRWVPTSREASLYLRPTAISTQVGDTCFDVRVSSWCPYHTRVALGFDVAAYVGSCHAA